MHDSSHHLADRCIFGCAELNGTSVDQFPRRRVPPKRDLMRRPLVNRRRQRQLAEVVEAPVLLCEDDMRDQTPLPYQADDLADPSPFRLLTRKTTFGSPSAHSTTRRMSR